MDTKYLLAAALLTGAILGGTFLATVSQKFRDLCFFLMITLSAGTEKFDVNFVSREWYRGTTCGYEVSVVDVFAISVLLSSILMPRRGQRRWFLPGSLGLMLIYMAFASFCVWLSAPKLFGMFALSKLLRGLIVFLAAAMFVQSKRELKLFIFALGLIVSYQGYLALDQRYRWGIDRVFGDLNAANSLSMYCCMTAPVFAAALFSNLPRYLKILSGVTIAFAGLSVVLTISRAGVLTIGTVLLATTLVTMPYKFTMRKVGIGLLVMLAVVAVMAKSWKTLSSRFAEASLRNEVQDSHSQGRGYYLRMAAAILREHRFGVGPNNWSYWVTNKYGPRMGFKFAIYPGPDEPPKFAVPAGSNVDDPQAAPAHSLWALTAGEMGWGGVALLLLLWLRWFQMGATFLWKRTPDPMRRIGVGLFFGTWGIFLQSLTEWVFHQTAIFFTFHIMLGVLASLYYLKKQEHHAEKLKRRIEMEEPYPIIANPVATW